MPKKQGKTKYSALRFRLPRVLCCIAVLTAIGGAFGLLSLWIAANSYGSVDGSALFASYFEFPMLIFLSVLLPILLAMLGYALFCRYYAALLVSGIPTLLLAVGNYFKLQLRGDPALASDIFLLRTAGGIVGNYTLHLTRPIELALAFALALAAACLLFAPKGTRLPWRQRLFCTQLCLILLAAAYAQGCTSEAIYTDIDNHALLSPWSETEDYLSRGVIVPFLYSSREFLIDRPDGYSSQNSERFLNSYACADIPEEQKITVMGIMLEAFADLTDYEVLAQVDDIAAVYEPFHELEDRTVSGRLYTNLFAGGTVETEWEVLSGYHIFDDFTQPTDSYVWYFADQGYDTLYQHPGYSWFYEREHVNQYLGFDASTFTENGFGELVDPVTALFHSDGVLYDYLLEQLDARTEEDAPLFTFSVTYQNHGPYNTEEVISPTINRSTVDWSDETFNILSNYLYGVGESIEELVRLTEELELRDDPVVLFAFGDHKPWLGDDKSVYKELDIDFDLSTLQGLENVYDTPYIIFANTAAKELLGSDFVGDGGNLSPCYLMLRVFDECGWDGPSFMQMQREMYGITPLLRPSSLFLDGTTLTGLLDDESMEFYQNYVNAQYWREKNVR